MTVLCILKVQRLKVGSADSTAFVIWSLPAWEINLEVLINLLSHLEMRGRKSATCGFVVPKGSPK
jgi:hypothetical protein